MNYPSSYQGGQSAAMYNYQSHPTSHVSSQLPASTTYGLTANKQQLTYNKEMPVSISQPQSTSYTYSNNFTATATQSNLNQNFGQAQVGNYQAAVANPSTAAYGTYNYGITATNIAGNQASTLSYTPVQNYGQTAFTTPASTHNQTTTVSTSYIPQTYSSHGPTSAIVTTSAQATQMEVSHSSPYRQLPGSTKPHPQYAAQSQPSNAYAANTAYPVAQLGGVTLVSQQQPSGQYVGNTQTHPYYMSNQMAYPHSGYQNYTQGNTNIGINNTQQFSKPQDTKNGEVKSSPQKQNISNIDLLSELDMNPSLAQWSPLQPNQITSDKDKDSLTVSVSSSVIDALQNNDTVDKPVASILEQVSLIFNFLLNIYIYTLFYENRFT